MKRVLYVVVLAFFSSFMAFAESPMSVEPDNIFVPYGFDSNDQSEVFLTGWLPTPCFTKPKVEVTVNGKNIDVEVKSYHKSADFCITMAYPYAIKADLGKLNHGSYKITVNGEPVEQARASIHISPATSGSIDDFVYAQVDDVRVSADKKTVTLTGYNPSDCVDLDLIHYTSNQKDTIAVLPIMRKVKEDCEKKLVPFSYSFDMPKLLPAETDAVLLHVRSLDGSAVNKLVRK